MVLQSPIRDLCPWACCKHAAYLSDRALSPLPQPGHAPCYPGTSLLLCLSLLNASIASENHEDIINQIKLHSLRQYIYIYINKYADSWRPSCRLTRVTGVVFAVVPVGPAIAGDWICLHRSICPGALDAGLRAWLGWLSWSQRQWQVVGSWFVHSAMAENYWSPITNWLPSWIKWAQIKWFDDVWCTYCWICGPVGARNWSKYTRWAHLSSPFSSTRAPRSGLRHVLAQATRQQIVTSNHAEGHRSSHDENRFRRVSIFLGATCANMSSLTCFISSVAFMIVKYSASVISSLPL